METKDFKKFPSIERRFDGEDKESFYQDFYNGDKDEKKCAALTLIAVDTMDAMCNSVVSAAKLTDFGFTLNDLAFVISLIVKETMHIAKFRSSGLKARFIQTVCETLIGMLDINGRCVAVEESEDEDIDKSELN